MGHGGAIGIEGTLDAGVLTLRWHETSDLPVGATSRDGGAGFTLIRRSLASSGGALSLSWRGDGHDVAVTLPGFAP